MKKVLKFAALLMASIAVVLTGCEPDVPEPTPVDPFEGASLQVKLVGADIDVATASLTAEVLKVASYIIEPTADKGTYTAEEIFANGTLVAIEKEGATQLTFRKLQPETNYTVQFAGRISANQIWSEIVEFKFKTAAEPIIPVLTAKLEGTEATTATIKLYAENIARVAYVTEAVTDAQNANTPNQQVIFATGKVVELVQGDNTIVIDRLSPNTEYVAHFAAEIAGIEEYMEEVITVQYIKTSDFADDIAVRDINYRGFTVDVKVDPSVKEQNHVIKWGTSDLFLYKMNGGGTGIDADLMNLHDQSWAGINLFNESRSLRISEYDRFIYDSNGDASNWYYESIVPGQPQVVMLGEYRRGESDWGWGIGYYKPLFDREQYLKDSMKGPVEEAAYWTGFYHNLLVEVQKPEPLPEDYISVEFEKEPDDAIIKITAHEDIEQVAVMVLSELEYENAMANLGDEKYLHWFTTSFMGAYQGVTSTIDPWNNELGLEGTFATALSQFLIEIPRESKFWVYVVGMRGDFDNDGFMDGYQQVCKSFEFYLPEPTKPAPEIEVVALESTSAFEVQYSIKCPTKDANYGKYIANYEKEWLMANMSASEIVDAYGLSFTSVELMKINSDEGMIVTYPSRPNSKTYFAAMVGNDEGTETFSDAVIAQSLVEPALDKVDSELFESLVGDWSASATISYQLYNSETEGYDPVTETASCNIYIGDVEYPANLDENAYAIFEKHGVDREDADAYYEEFKVAAKTFNDNTNAQNRILMNGWDFTNGVMPNNYYTYSDPYSLFISDTYNGLNSEMPLYDFGPKWYLEVTADGTVRAPFNVNYFTPMSSWYAYNGAIYESHFVAYEPTTGNTIGFMGDEDGNLVNGYFPVEVSEDGNTITIKPLTVGNANYYPNGALYYGVDPSTGYPTYAMSIGVVSEVVLTRTTSSAAAPKKVARKNVTIKERNVISTQKITPPARPAGRNAIGEPVHFEMVERDMNLTPEQRGKLWMENRRNAGRQ